MNKCIDSSDFCLLGNLSQGYIIPININIKIPIRSKVLIETSQSFNFNNKSSKNIIWSYHTLLPPVRTLLNLGLGFMPDLYTV